MAELSPKRSAKLPIGNKKAVITIEDDKIIQDASLKFKSNSIFLAGKNYSIADIATFPWIARHAWHDIGLKNYTNLCRWYKTISEREAVKKGFDALKNGEKIPEV